MVAVTGRCVGDPHVAGAPLHAQVGLGTEELVERARIERDAGRELERRHHLVADVDCRDRVDRAEHDTGEAADDAFDRGRGEVLPIDA